MSMAQYGLKNKSLLLSALRDLDEHVLLQSRDLQTSPQIVHMHKGCIDDDNKVF